jgi:predicted nucleotide-binding protein
MKKHKLLAKLRAAGFSVIRNVRNADNRGRRLELDSGAIVTLYDTGTVVVQGKNPVPARTALGVPADKCVLRARRPKMAPKVFVVCGRARAARTQLEVMLKRWKLQPLFLTELTSQGQTVVEKLASVRKEANFAVVLATPDDEGHRKRKAHKKAFRARQKVVLHLGMMLGHLGRSKVAILIKSDVHMELPSQIHGLLYIPYKKDVADAKVPLAKAMRAQGIPIDLNGL